MSEAPAIPDISANLETLPSPPFVAMEIIRLANDHDSSAADLAAVLSNDAVLATRILQVANSPAYGLAREVTTIDRATALLGLKAVKMMALSFSLAGDVGDTAGALSIESYWYHSLFNAVTARRWAELMAPGLAEEAFLTGLLSHLGRLVLAQEKATEFADLLSAHHTLWPSFHAEHEVFGFTSADVTVALLEEWGLPALIVQGANIMYRGCDPDPDVNGAAELGRVLENVVLTEAALGSTAGAEAIDRLHEAVVAAGVDGDAVEDFVVELESRIRDLADMLDVTIPADMSHAQMLNEARTRLVEVSLEAVQNLKSAEEQAEELRQSNKELEGMAFEDRLTGVPNRAALDDHLARVVAGAVRGDFSSVGMILFDIDHFKSFNDTYGHQLGDDVLRAVAQAMKATARTNEMFARYGGEEFALVAIGCVGEDLIATGERLRRAVEELRVPSSAGDLAVTVSGGAAVIADVANHNAGEWLTKAADEALYAAKEAGRNQIRLAP